MPNKLTKAQKLARDNRFIEGMQQHLGHMTLILNKEDVPAKTVIATVQAHIERVREVDALHAALGHAIAAEREANARVVALMSSIRGMASSHFGVDSSEFTDLGFHPPKKRVQSPESKVRAAERMRATRVARRTLGPKQRLAIKGGEPVTPPY